VGKTSNSRANGLKIIKTSEFRKGRVGTAHPVPACLLVDSNLIRLMTPFYKKPFVVALSRWTLETVNWNKKFESNRTDT